jgi:phosphatidylglycerophosphatase A
MTAHRMIASCFGIGKLPEIPGTWASAAAIPLAWALHAVGGFWTLGPATLALMLTGYWATSKYLASQPGDSPEVVIDEVVGMLVALWPLSIGLSHSGADWHVWPWPGWVLGFFLFRFFGILKPPPVSWASRVSGPLGVMLDDIVAGVLTASIMVIAAGVAHGWF